MSIVGVLLGFVIVLVSSFTGIYTDTILKKMADLDVVVFIWFVGWRAQGG